MAGELKTSCACPVKSFQIAPDGTLTVEGLGSDEVRDLLQVYREHVELMMLMAHGSGNDLARWQANHE